VNFEEYLVSKKINSAVFREKEQAVWAAWQIEFEQMHPNSFTIQKLNLINPVRRKYPLKIEIKPDAKPVTQTSGVKEAVITPENTSEVKQPEQAKPIVPKPAVARPVFKPKPKAD